MPTRRTRNINDVYERIMARMDERLDQFVDQFSNRMNDMMNLRRCGDRNGRRSEDEELGNPFFEGDCSSSNEWGDHGVAGDDYEGAPVFDDGYEEAPIFDDDQFEEESMPVYDTDIEDVIGEEEENMEDIVVVANDLCSSMIQTTLSVDFSKNINSNPHELIFNLGYHDFGSKVTHLEKIIAQKTKDFDDVKLELSNRTAKFEAYFEKLENTKVVLERQLARKVDDSKAEKDQFLKEIIHLRTQLENLKGKSVKTKFDKSSILGKPPTDKLLITSQLSKSWSTPKVVVQKGFVKTSHYTVFA
ncbi:hypothetical protein Tco_1147000 [Tanacetum coccineum]